MPQKPSRATVRGHSPIPPGTPAQKIEGDLCQGTNFENLIPKFGSRYVRYIEETLQYQKQSISGYHLQVETVLEKRSLRKFVGSIFSEQHCRKCTTRLLHYIQVAITISESHVVKHSWKSGPTMLSIILCTTLHSEKVKRQSAPPVCPPWRGSQAVAVGKMRPTAKQNLPQRAEEYPSRVRLQNTFETFLFGNKLIFT